MARMQDKVCLVTGGASGIGRGIAQRFIEEGAQSIITDIDAEAAEKTANEIGARALAHDVADERAWEQVIEETLSRCGRLDVLVNNAGIFTSCPVDETPLEQWRHVLDVNLTGVFLGCKHGIKAMKSNPAGPSGSIVNLSSVVGLRGQLGGSAYSASKGGVRLLTKTVALENAPLGIRCNSVHPGIIDTPILDPILEAAEDADALRAVLARGLPIGYLGDPARDVGNMAVYLASDESVYITGTEMVVDGGMTVGLPG